MFAWLREYAAPPEPGVTIWFAELEAVAENEFQQLRASLHDEEQARANRFHLERDRRTYVLCRATLRHLLGVLLETPPEGVAIESAPKGKPLLLAEGGGSHPLCFNLSHTSRMAAFAFAHEREVGIDLENADRLAGNEDLDALAANILSARELSVWRKLPDANARRAAFLRAWTRKEAYVKATGSGVFDGLSRLEVILDEAAPERSLRLGDWTVYHLQAPSGFCAALAIASV